MKSKSAVSGGVGDSNNSKEQRRRRCCSNSNLHLELHELSKIVSRMDRPGIFRFADAKPSQWSLLLVSCVHKSLKMASLLSSSAALRLAAASRTSARVALCRYMSVTTLSDKEALEKFRMLNHKSVLYFTASWCPPCKKIGPVYEGLSKKFTDVAFGKIDVDENSDAALDFEISAVPTFVMFEGEHATEKFSGADEEKLERHIKYLNDLES